MKKDIHPSNYRLVVFKDMSNEEMFLCKSTAETKDTIVYEGVEYPLVKMEISSTSHPFYTGKPPAGGDRFPFSPENIYKEEYRKEKIA